MSAFGPATMDRAPPRTLDAHPAGGAALAALGGAALLMGMVVYALWRRGSVPMPAVVAVLAGSAPSLLHAFAFTLWTALALRGPPRTAWALALAWTALEAGIEAFQHPALHALLPAAVATRWAGTFDPWDLLAALLGAGMAGLLAFRHATPNEAPP